MGMTAYASASPHTSANFWRWLRFGHHGAAPEAAPYPGDLAGAVPVPADDAPDDPQDTRRNQVLAQVAGFLVTHRLDVNTFTLAIAHDVVTESDHQLARLVGERIVARQPITLGWLEQASRDAGRDDGAAALNALMRKLETSIEEFARTASAARSATHDYSSSLESHVDELEQVSKAGAVLSDLAMIARVMLDRTREVEKHMNHSELQTRALQKNLDEARRSAETDHLTGLPNRRAFESVFETELAEAAKHAEPLCIAFCDIDNFKHINDTHGHEAGDRVLKAVAQTLAKISDERCHVARHGGEEFVILFRGAPLDRAFTCLDEAREAMAERKLVNRATDVPFGRVTFSAGLAEVGLYPFPRDAMRAADEALYRAKNNGRNRIEIAGAAGNNPRMEAAA